MVAWPGLVWSGLVRPGLVEGPRVACLILFLLFLLCCFNKNNYSRFFFVVFLLRFVLLLLFAFALFLLLLPESRKFEAFYGRVSFRVCTLAQRPHCPRLPRHAPPPSSFPFVADGHFRVERFSHSQCGWSACPTDTDRLQSKWRFFFLSSVFITATAAATAAAFNL